METKYDPNYCDEEADRATLRKRLLQVIWFCLLVIALFVLITTGPADSLIEGRA